MRKCLIVDPMHESIFSMLQEIDWESDYHPEISREELRSIVNNYQGIIVRSKTTVDRELIGENPSIRFVGRAGAGLDNLDLNYLKSKNIQVLHAAEGNREAVGEHAIGMLLSLLRNIPRADQQVRNSTWHREENRGEELNGKTVAIIGYGNMGSAFARCLKGFGCKVLAYDRYKSAFSDDYVREADMKTIFDEADIVSFHTPLTHETRMLINASYLNQFQKDVILINTARGEILSLVDICEALKSGKVRGAALDVLENEKLDQLTDSQQKAFNFLAEQTNVILTPHIAGWTFESHVKINVALVNKIKELIF